MSKHNLPAPRTSFVGREREMVEATRMLAMTRLLTLTGPGGCGKTRLALEASRDLVGNYPDGVWFVQLAPLSEGDASTASASHDAPCARAAGPPTARHPPKRAARRRDAPHLGQLRTPDRRYRATCACPIGLLSALAGTRHQPRAFGRDGRAKTGSYPPLHTRPARVSDGGRTRRLQSAQLFADRASIRCPGFELTPENATAVAKVCARLEGIPLAIELAAASVGILSAEQISDRLGHSLNILTGGERIADPRHRTLRATLDWSHQLLSEPEQVLFRGLSVYAGGFTLEAAEATGAGGVIEQEDVLDLLSMLVDKSLVVAEESWQSGSRYRLLEPIRQYSREKLKEGEEEEQTRYRHTQSGIWHWPRRRTMSLVGQDTQVAASAGD